MEMNTSRQALLHELCCSITGLEAEDEVLPYFQMALTVIESAIDTPRDTDEFQVVQRVKRKLVRNQRMEDALLFSEVHRKLQSKHVLNNLWSVLYFLLQLYNENSSEEGSCQTFGGGFGDQMTSTPYMGVIEQLMMPHQPCNPDGSSGISSIHGLTASTLPSGHLKTLPHQDRTAHLSNSTGSQAGNRLVSLLDQCKSPIIESVRDRRALTVSRNYDNRENTSLEIPESELVRDIIYIFLGVNGKYISIDENGGKVDAAVGIPKSMRTSVLKLAECGWLYNKVRRDAYSRISDLAIGLVGQSFGTALNKELTEYHRLVAVLEAQMNQEEDNCVAVSQGALTLRRVHVWMFDPRMRLKALAIIVDGCQGKKGGALASAVHSYMQTGDPLTRSIVEHSLTLVAQPIFTTVMLWLYDGKLEDTYHEFFIASDPFVGDDRLWNDKYSLRKSMIPSFLSMDQAKKILLTGKSINFLRQVCHDQTIIRDRCNVIAVETCQVESIFSSDLDGDFQKMIDTVYMETSQHLLEVLHQKYQFMDHLKALRRYLLLGQGDFIRHLMDLLQEKLNKPAGTLFLHNLTGILDTAIRATNARYDDDDIVKRVDVRLLEASPGDTGWDVFSIDYHVNGPIRTVFTPECMIKYLRVFNFLWRAKRMEYILAVVWKSQTANTRSLRAIPELAPVQHQCHVISSEMVHFVQQVQYYINFEVLACSWDELLTKVHEAEDLDHIIEAHQDFLETIITRSLLDPESSKILTQLRTIFDLIIQFQTIQENMYAMSNEELSLRQVYESKQKTKSNTGDWGLTEGEEDIEMTRRLEFVQTVVPQIRSQLRVLHQSYQTMVHEFLLMLTRHNDVNLRFLSFRLDFNEYYMDKKLPIAATPHIN